MTPFRIALALALALTTAPAFAQTYTQDFEGATNEYFQPIHGENCTGSTLEITEARAHGGKKSGKLAYKLSGKGNVQVISTAWPTVVASGDKLHLSVWIHGAGKDDFTGGGLVLVDSGNETFLYWIAKPLEDALASNGWTELSVDIDTKKPAGHWGGKNTGVIALPLKLGGLGLDYSRTTAAQGEVFFDDLTLTGAPATPAAALPAPVPAPTPTPKVSVSLAPNGDGLYLYPPGGLVMAHVTSVGLAGAGATTPPTARGRSFEWSAKNFDDAEIARGSVTLDATGAGDFSIPASAPGIVYVTVTAGGAKAATQFAVMDPSPIPVAPATAHAPMLFGVCTHYQGLARADRERETALISALGFQACRFDYSWGNIQPDRDVWKWDIYDHVFGLMDKYRIEPLPVISYSTRWATTGDPTAKDWHLWANVPPRTDDYVKFAAESAKRYSKSATYWEVWNEPDIDFWRGTAEQYAALFDATSAGIKAVEPNAKVMNGGFSETLRRPAFIPTWMRLVKSRPDIFAFHSHMVFANLLRADNGVRQYFKNAGWSAPKWLNEAGFSSTGSLTERDEAIAVVKKMGFSPALGIDGYFWYDLRNDGNDRSDSESNYGLANADFTPKSGAIAAHTLIRLLDGKRFANRLAVEGTPGAYALLYATDHGKGGTLVLWNEAKSVVPLTWRAPGNVAEVTIMGEQRPLKSTDGLVSLAASPLPTFLTFTGSASDFKASGRLLDFASPVIAAPSDTVPLRVTVHNPLAHELRGTLSLRPDGGWRVGQADVPVAVAAGKDTVVIANLVAPASGDARRTLRLTLASPSLPAPQEGMVELQQATVIPKQLAPTLGDLTAWSAPLAHLGRGNVVSLYEATPMQELLYHGEGDLSADLYLARVPAGLRIALKVRDDVFHQDQPVGAEWQGDSIQFALGLPTGENYEWTAALTKSGTVANLGFAPAGVELGKVPLDESVKHDGEYTVYDLVVPQSLPGGKTLPDRFSFTVLVNDNDGQGRKGWVEYTPGIGRSKDPSQYQPIVVR